MKHATRLAGGVLASLLFLCGGLRAQVAGRISGYVRDPSNAVVAGATVAAVSDEQQFRRTTTSDQTGFYNLLALPPGVYEISVENAGFEKLLQTGVTLALGESLRLDPVLKVGAVQSEITVASTATLVN